MGSQWCDSIGLDGGWGGADLLVQATRFQSLFRHADSDLVPVMAVLFGDAQLNRGGRLLAGAVFGDCDLQLVGARPCRT